MNLAAVQPFVAAQLAADPAVSGLGAALIFDPFADPKVAQDAIDTRLRIAGVCFEVGEIDLDRVDTGPGGKVATVAACQLYVSETARPAHTPAGLALVQAAIEAVCRRTGHAARTAALTSSVTLGTQEQGRVLHILEFEIPVSFP